jgi:predicted aspartyl protease
LKLVAALDLSRQARVTGSLTIENGIRNFPVEFVIDTGAVRTCILKGHIRRMRINSDEYELYDFTFSTAIGKVRPRAFKKTHISLMCLNEMGQQYPESFSFPDLPFIPIEQEDNNRKFRLQSLIGMDLLQLFPFWEYTENELILSSNRYVTSINQIN